MPTETVVARADRQIPVDTILQIGVDLRADIERYEEIELCYPLTALFSVRRDCCWCIGHQGFWC